MSLELALKGLIAEILTEAGVIKSAAGDTAEVVPAAAKRGRGRPVTGEATAAATPAAAVPVATSPVTTSDDPFAAPAAPAAPTATIEEVRAALTALKVATSQENALKVLKDSSGSDNLTALPAAKYGAVVVAAKAAIPGAKPAVIETDDPFAIPAAAPAEKPPTLEELKALIVETQKRTSQDTVQKVVMEYGGKGKNPDTGIEGPSLKALPAEQYVAVAAKLKALPSTK